MKMKAEDGKFYAEITLRDVVEKNDVSDMPLLSEVKRLYDENAKLRELLADTLIDPRDYCSKYGIDYDGLGWDSANEDIDRRLRELEIEV